MSHSLHSARRLGPPLLGEAALVLLVCLGTGGPLAGCKSVDKAAEQPTLAVTGRVILPDSTALFGAEISTDPPTGYVSTDEAGRFRVALPGPLRTRSSLHTPMRAIATWKAASPTCRFPTGKHLTWSSCWAAPNACR